MLRQDPWEQAASFRSLREAPLIAALGNIATSFRRSNAAPQPDPPLVRNRGDLRWFVRICADLSGINKKGALSSEGRPSHRQVLRERDLLPPARTTFVGGNAGNASSANLPEP